MNCSWCGEEIPDGEDYNLSPDDEPVHAGDCHTAVWDAYEASKEYLSAGEVADNFRDYTDALEAEIEMSETLIEALEDGEVEPGGVVEVLPTPTPLEAWQSDRWDELGEDYDPMELAPIEEAADGGR